MSTHLGDLIAAFVDDQLEPAQRDAVLAHVAWCPACQTEVSAQRMVKARLTQLGAPSFPTTLQQRLCELPRGGFAPPSPPLVRSAPPPPNPDLISGAGRSRRRDGRRLLAGVASLLLATAGAAYASGSQARTPSSGPVTTRQPTSVTPVSLVPSGPSMLSVVSLRRH